MAAHISKNIPSKDLKLQIVKATVLSNPT